MRCAHWQGTRLLSRNLPHICSYHIAGFEDSTRSMHNRVLTHCVGRARPLPKPEARSSSALRRVCIQASPCFDISTSMHTSRWQGMPLPLLLTNASGAGAWCPLFFSQIPTYCALSLTNVRGQSSCDFKDFPALYQAQLEARSSPHSPSLHHPHLSL